MRCPSDADVCASDAQSRMPLGRLHAHREHVARGAHAQGSQAEHVALGVGGLSAGRASSTSISLAVSNRF